MLKNLKTLFGNLNLFADAETGIDSTGDVKFAVAILLAEVMHADHQLDEQEQDLIIKLLQQQFALDEYQALELYNKANEKMKDAVSLYKYTSQVNNALSHKEKQTLMVNLWRVVFADGRVDKYEEHLIRRVADLMHLSHSDFIKARHFAEESS